MLTDSKGGGCSGCLPRLGLGNQIIQIVTVKTVVINEDTLSILQMLRLDGHVASRRLCHWATQYRSKLRTEVGAKGTDSGISMLVRTIRIAKVTQ